MLRWKRFRGEIREAFELEDRVCHHLSRQKFPVFRNLSVNANRGKVIVSGTVRTFYERQIAINSALQVVGVTELTDDITVAENQ